LLNAHAKQLLDWGVLRPTQPLSNQAAFAFLVLKSNRTESRLVLNLEDWSAPQWWPTCKLPTINDIHQSVEACSYFVVLDLLSWFYQFATTGGPYIRIGSKFFQLVRLPQGWCGSPALAQLVLLVLLASLASFSVNAKGYLDNVLLSGRSRREVLRALRHFLDRCEELGILVKPGSIVQSSQVEYLGMRIAKGG
jgi:hypothetical protein